MDDYRSDLGEFFNKPILNFFKFSMFFSNISWILILNQEQLLRGIKQ